MKLFGDRFHVIYEPESSNQTSKIYVCKDLISNDVVFIKLLKSELIGDEVATELVFRECKSLEVLNHQNVIKYLDSGFQENRPYIVTQYFDSKNLYDYISQNKLETEEKIDILIKIINALIYTHDKGVIHRDLKPQNVLINDDHDIKIIDFGISKIMGMIYNPSVTLKNYMSCRYAPPEQIQMLEARVGSDLFSFGLLMAYIFTEIEPPDNRSEFKNYLDRIENIELKGLIKDLIKTDISERPKNGYKIAKELKKIKALSISQNEKIYFKVSRNAKEKLYSMGFLNNINNFIEINSFIQSDKKEYTAYKLSDRYCFIGEKIKYICKLSDNQDYFYIIDINALEDYRIWDQENSRGYEFYFCWQILDYNREPNSGLNSTLSLVRLLTDLELENNNQKNRRSIENKLINSWNSLLEDEFQIVDERKKIGRYSGFAYDDTGYKLHVNIKECNLELTSNDRIQLSLKKENIQKTVGYYDGLIDEHTISVIADSNIEIDDFSQMGTIGLDTFQERVNLRRFANALKSVKNCETINSNIPMILNNPSLISINQIQSIERFFQSEFTDEDLPNALAVKKALATKDLFLLQGPPGTGKTTVISEIICQILNKEPNSKILLTSQSNVAVDHATKKVEALLPDRIMIRIGRIDRIAKSSEKLLYKNQIEDWVRSVKLNSSKYLCEYINEKYPDIEEIRISDYLSSASLNDNQYKQMQEVFPEIKDDKVIEIIESVVEWQICLGKIDEFDEIFADKASLVAATCMGIASRNKLGEMEYDWVIIDEAAKATPLETLVPLVKGKKIIMVGDHRQLPPTIKKNYSKEKLKELGLKKSDLEKSLFEELIENISPAAKMVLTEQFRMHPNISNMISNVFYPSIQLQTKVRPEDRNHNIKRWEGKSIIWKSTDNLKENKEKPVAFSKKNLAEAKSINNMLDEVEKEYQTNGRTATVGVISAYQAQKKVLIDLISPDNKSKWKALSISIDNVDAYQGSEVDIAIYSIVRCNDENTIGFLSDERRLNVALSRGRTALIIVGNYNFAKHARGEGSNPFTEVIKYIEQYPESCLMEACDE